MTADEMLRQLIEAEQAYRKALQAIQDDGGLLFKEVRQQHGLTQRALADLLRVDHSFVSKVENGHVRPGKPVLSRLATWLTEQSHEKERE